MSQGGVPAAGASSSPRGQKQHAVETADSTSMEYTKRKAGLTMIPAKVRANRQRAAHRVGLSAVVALAKQRGGVTVYPLYPFCQVMAMAGLTLLDLSRNSISVVRRVGHESDCSMSWQP